MYKYHLQPIMKIVEHAVEFRFGDVDLNPVEGYWNGKSVCQVHVVNQYHISSPVGLPFGVLDEILVYPFSQLRKFFSNLFQALMIVYPEVSVFMDRHSNSGSNIVAGNRGFFKRIINTMSRVFSILKLMGII